jgi:hypothetical protein
MRRRSLPAVLAVLTLAVTGSGAVTAASSAQEGAQVFVPGAVLNADHTVTLPLHRGRSGNQVVWFIATEASDSNHAARWGTSVSQKLRNARHTAAVQKVSLDPDGTVVFPATVDFSPTHVITPGPSGFPPAAAAPGAVGNPGYTPLIQLPDGAVLNAPQIANDTGQADKALTLDRARHQVRYLLTDGFSRTHPVVYLSTESSDPGAAAIEDVTYAPSLNAAPFTGGDGTDSARRGGRLLEAGPRPRASGLLEPPLPAVGAPAESRQPEVGKRSKSVLRPTHHWPSSAGRPNLVAAPTI